MLLWTDRFRQAWSNEVASSELDAVWHRKEKEKTEACGGEVVRGAGGKLVLEAAGKLHRDLQMRDLKSRIGFRLAQRPCSQSSSLICAARGTCSKAHSKINSPRVGVF